MRAVQRRWRGPIISCYILGLISIGVSLFLIRAYFNKYTYLTEDNRRQITQTVKEGVDLLNKELYKIIDPVRSLSRTLSTKVDQKESVVNDLKSLLQHHPILEAVGIAYVPSQATEEKLFYTYFLREKDEIKKHVRDPYYDYTLTDWYRKAKNEGETWVDSYYEASSGRLVVRYVMPVYRFDKTSGNRVPIAYLFVDISRQKLMLSINELDVGGGSNYVMVVSREGELISYPVEDFVVAYQNLSNLSRLPGKAQLSNVAERIKRGGGQGMMRYHDDLSDESFFVYFAPIKNTDWFFVLFSQQENLFYEQSLRRKLIQIGIASLFVLLFLLIIATTPLRGTTKRGWIVSLIFSFGVLVLLIVQLYLSFITAQKIPVGEFIGNRVDLNRFSYFIERRNQQLNKPSLIQIPTGIWVEYLLSEKERIMLSGIIWQKYDNKTTKGIDRAIGILNAQDLNLEKLYDVQKGDAQLIGWRFKASLNVEFDYLTYPFDSQTLTAQLFHPDFEKNIMLTPDFDSYSLAEIIGKVGLGKVYKEPSLIIKNSYYSYQLRNNATDFGIPDSVRQDQFPNLFYNIVVTRDVTTPLISYVFPMVIMVAILFYVLLEASITKVSLSSALARISGLFLATVFAHQALRSGLANLAGVGTGGLTYLEYLYFVMYFFIMLTLNFIFYIHFRRKGDIIDDAIARGLKFVYWPLLMIASLMVTIYFFY